MKIIYCIAGTYNSGGMERVLANKANYLVDQGHEVAIVTTDQQGRAPYFTLNDHIKQYDLAINYVDDIDKSIVARVSTYLKKQKLHKQRLTKFLQQEHADIVISMFDHEVSFLHNIIDGSKKILEIHFSRFKRLQYGRGGIKGIIDSYRSKQDLRLAKKYDRFVVLTQEDKGYWGELPNISVISNANTFEPKEVASLNAKQAIAVGRYDYQKGFDDLIQAWGLVKTQHPDWILNIYGHGPLKEDLSKLINSLGLQEQVFLCPPTKAIEKAYCNSALALMTSRYEGLPMALLEAQACGLPMVSYTCKCGPRDIIIDGENGYLVPEGDINHFADKVNQILASAKLRQQMGEKARKRAKDFAVERVMQQWTALFEQLTQTTK